MVFKNMKVVSFLLVLVLFYLLVVQQAQAENETNEDDFSFGG